jgi:hypothetical protein
MICFPVRHNKLKSAVGPVLLFCYLISPAPTKSNVYFVNDNETVFKNLTYKDG